MVLGVIIICCLLAVIVLLVALLYFEKIVINEVFDENHDLKLRLFNLIREEEVKWERLFTNKASFDEKCLYDLVRRVEIIEKKMDGKNTNAVAKIDVIYPKKEGG